MTGVVSRDVPRRERRQLLTLLAYVKAGSHKAAAHRLAISESTSRQRVSSLLRRIGARTAAEAVWRLHGELEAEDQRQR
jgi:DNA-binding NarL/FixJ family response regulator